MHVAIVSAGRPGNVPAMTAWCEPVGTPTWYVPTGQATAYRDAGATDVREVDGALIEQRNVALDTAAAAGDDCLQLDDDLKRLQLVTGPGQKPTTIDLGLAVEVLREGLTTTGARLAGGASTPNPYFARRPYSTEHFVIAQLTLTRPGALRYDPQLRLKEDYDLTAQHLAAWGAVARCDYLLPTFQHYGNAGGCQTYRTPEREAESVRYLLRKWPGVFRENPRRAGEVLMVRGAAARAFEAHPELAGPESPWRTARPA